MAQPIYVKVEYPRVVYGPDGATKIINTADEWPEGWAASPHEEVSVDDAAAAAKLEAKKAEKEYRKGIMEYLDEHSVDYAKNISTPKLEALKTELDDYLTSPEDPV